MATKYPTSVDGYAEIRVAVDKRSEIVAGDHNDLRSAILAIERTLGVNPQGPFGTVVARLNDAYSNIEAHVLGNPPRHFDDVIMSPVRTGVLPTSLDTPPYSLVAGPLADQVSSILEFLNDAIMYGGSGSSTFADGASISLSLIRNAITEIVSQLGGGTTGTQKISGASISGTNFSVSSGTLKAQLISLLNLIDAFGNSTGSGLVGTTGFSTSTGTRYTFSGTDVQSQLIEAGNFLDEGASFRDKAFNAFVVEGLAVSGSGGTANVSSGFVSANGRILKYSGGSVVVPDGTTSYVYMEVSSGVASANISTSIPTRPENPVVLLHKIIRSGATWTTSIDIRRYGVFVNDKNYISVGNKPISGKDGYGCDFTSLKSAIEYVKIINNGNELIPPMKILLSSDISITSSSEMEIALTLEGIEIDGCGRKITTNQDYKLFDVLADNITLTDITLESNLGVSGTKLCLAVVGNSTNIINLSITNCKLTKAGSTACPYFLRLGSSGGSTTVSNSVFSENIVEVELGGIEYQTSNKYAQVLKNSVIVGNIIYQDIFSATSYSGIKASQYCTIGDNIIKGGFNTGILLAYPTQCRIDGNLILGFQSSTTVMLNGIAIWNNASGQDNGCVISDNTIKGISNYGINCRAGTGSGAFISIYGNFIDNYYSVGTPPSTMIAIKGRGAETWVVGNKITAPGIYAIENCSHAIGNQIYGNPSITTTTSAIEMATSSIGVIANNTINGVAGTGIQVNNNSGITISGNVLLGNSNSSVGIDYIGDDSIVVGNTINSYNSAGIQSTTGDRITISDNRLISCQGWGIKVTDCAGSIITNNWLQSVIGSGSSGISGVGSSSIISNNYIANYGAGGYGIELSVVSFSNYNVLISGNIMSNLYSGTNGAFYTPNGWSRISAIGNILFGCPKIGFHFNGTSQVLCSNNIMQGTSNSSHGIFEVGDSCNVNNNVIIQYGGEANSYGISTSTSSKKTLISGNVIDTPRSNLDYGIYIGAGSFYTIADNLIVGTYSFVNKSPIHMNGSTDSIILNNFMITDQTGTSGYHGIKDIGSRSIVSGNFIKNANYYGIEIDGSYVICNNNIIQGSSNSSIYLTSSGDFSTISGNSILQSLNYGIKGASGASNLLIQGNMIYSVGATGIEIYNSVFCNITGNYIYDPSYSGIILSGTSGGTLISSNWIFSPSFNGLYIDTNSAGCLISGNWIRDSIFQGIVIYSNEITICGNYLTRCGGNGVSQIDLTYVDDWVCVGNSVNSPTNSSTIGINLDYGERGICVGNRIYGVGADSSISMKSSVEVLCVGNRVSNSGSIMGIDYTSATNYVIDANIAKGGANPGGFGALPRLGDDNGYAS